MTVSVPTTTTSPLAGATSHDKVDWHKINWPKVHREVQRLQARIVQAEQAGKRGKVKALQRGVSGKYGRF
jgi:RNA-directed DNA polymerase